MNLLNEQVKHQSFGTGKVIEQLDSYIKVQFAKGSKRFVYPDVFGEFLTIVDQDLAKHVSTLMNELAKEREQNAQAEAKKRALEYEREQRRLEREKIMRNYKLHSASQVAFWLDQEEQDQVFTTWEVFTGEIKSGQNQGKPNRLPRIHQNSACLLTARAANLPEKQRKVIGLFMVDEGFIGKLNTDGNIPAHPKYRLRLSPEESERILFWNYYINKRYPTNMTWNSGRHRYFENTWLAQVLQDILRLKQDPKEQQFMEEFLEYFCHLNQLEEELPKPSGCLSS